MHTENKESRMDCDVITLSLIRNSEKNDLFFPIISWDVTCAK